MGETADRALSPVSWKTRHGPLPVRGRPAYRLARCAARGLRLRRLAARTVPARRPARHPVAVDGGAAARARPLARLPRYLLPPRQHRPRRRRPRPSARRRDQRALEASFGERRPRLRGARALRRSHLVLSRPRCRRAPPAGAPARRARARGDPSPLRNRLPGDRRRRDPGLVRRCRAVRGGRGARRQRPAGEGASVAARPAGGPNTYRAGGALPELPGPHGPPALASQRPGRDRSSRPGGGNARAGAGAATTARSGAGVSCAASSSDQACDDRHARARAATRITVDIVPSETPVRAELAAAMPRGGRFDDGAAASGGRRLARRLAEETRSAARRSARVGEGRRPGNHRS